MRKNSPIPVPASLLERAAYWRNRPMLLFLLAAFPVVLAAGSLYDAFLLSLITLVLTVATQTVLSFVAGRMAQWARILCAALLSAGVMTGLYPLIGLCFPDFFERTLFVLPMLVLQPMVLPLGDARLFALPPKTAVWDALVRSAFFAAVVLVCGLLREFLAYGSVFGVALLGEDAALLPAFAEPFGGFALLGLEAALVQGIFRRYRHKKAEGGREE